MSTTPATRPPPPRRVRKRWLIPSILLGLIAIAFIVVVVRGSWADHEPRDPKSSADGILCRLYQPAEGDWQVRCSMVLDYSPEKVWSVLTDYDHFEDIFPTLESCTLKSQDKEKHLARLTGEAHSMLGTWPFDIDVHEEVEPGKRYNSHWEGDSGDVQKIKGSWTVTPAGEGKTLLVYASHVEIKRYPDWAVVNALLLRQPRVMKAVDDRLKKNQ